MATAKESHERVRAEVFGLVFLVAQQLTRRADEELAPMGLTTSQWLLLAVLAKRFPGEAPRLSEAAAVYGSSRQNVKQVAQKLAERGFLELRRDPSDARVIRLQLTRKMALFDEAPALARQARMMDSMFSGLSIHEAAELERTLRRWLAALEGRRPATPRTESPPPSGRRPPTGSRET